MASRIFRIYKSFPNPVSQDQEFSNVYRYSVDTAGTGFPADRAVAVIDALKELERTIHSASVTFTRAESAEVTVLNGVQAIDVNVDFSTDPNNKGLLAVADPPVAPENTMMFQERVGPKRWLRKYIHHCSLSFALNADGIAVNYEQGSATQTDAINGFASGLSPLSYVEPNGSAAEAIYEAGNGTASGGMFEADQRIRWHDLAY